MSYLLDSHAFLWCAMRPAGLSARVRELLADSSNGFAVSAVSLWELSLKQALGKLDLSGVTPSEFPRIAGEMGLDVLPLDGATAATFHQMPVHPHRDPFDRLLAWQAIRGKLILVSKDRQLDAYKSAGLKRVW